LEVAKAANGVADYPVSLGTHSNDVFPNSEKRFALVISVSDYTGIQPLPNCVNDATDITRALNAAGFDVMKVADKNKADIESAVNYASGYYATNGYNVALVYFTGHGADYAGFQLLAPLNFIQPANAGQKEDLKYYLDNCVVLADVIHKFTTNQSKCVLGIIDACRKEDYVRIPEKNISPYDERLNIWRRYLETDSKVSIFYATSLGSGTSSTSDNGKNSLFSSYVIAALSKKPGSWDNFVRDVQDEVKLVAPMPHSVGGINFPFKFFENTGGEREKPELRFMVESIERPDPHTKWLIFTIRNTGTAVLTSLYVSGNWYKTDLATTGITGSPAGGVLLTPRSRIQIKVKESDPYEGEDRIEYRIKGFSFTEKDNLSAETPIITHHW
jgi:hypothetical protein